MSKLCPHCRQPLPGAHGVILDDDKREVRVGTKTSWHLAQREYDLMGLLFAKIGRVVPKSDLHDGLIGRSQRCSPKTLSVFVHHLRKKIRPTGLIIECEWGVGYRLREPG